MQKNKEEGQQVIDLNKLSRAQLVNLVLSLSNNNNKTSIRFFDVIVSANESLQSCEATLNRIIEANKSFIESRKTKRNPLVDYYDEE